MKPIKIECPSCQQPIELELPPAPPPKGDNAIRAFLVLLCGCTGLIAWEMRPKSALPLPPPASITASSAPLPIHWEYKVVTETNWAISGAAKEANRDDQRIYDGMAGGFIISDRLLSDDYGLDGWELVSAAPVQQTLYPNQHAALSFERNDNANIRTSQIILVFKRPAR